MFQVGQRVICVKPFPEEPARSCGIDSPKRGRIYTVREVGIDGNLPFLLLAEVRNPTMLCRSRSRGLEVTEPGFNATYFRPIVERKTDISVFEKLLTPEKVRA